MPLADVSQQRLGFPTREGGTNHHHVNLAQWIVQAIRAVNRSRCEQQSAMNTNLMSFHETS